MSCTGFAPFLLDQWSPQMDVHTKHWPQGRWLEFFFQVLFFYLLVCVRVPVRACVCEICLTFFLLPVRNVKCWFCVLFVFEAVFQVTWMTLSFWSSCLAFWVLGLQVFITMSGFCDAEEQTQGFVHPRQELYKLSHSLNSSVCICKFICRDSFI